MDRASPIFSKSLNHIEITLSVVEAGKFLVPVSVPKLVTPSQPWGNRFD
jgi:hypothetical protein